jgi:outer membrane protein TolC
MSIRLHLLLASSLAIAVAPVMAAEPEPIGALTATRRLSTPSESQANYAGLVRQSLLRLAEEHPEVQSARAAANTGQYAVDSARQARYPRFRMGTSSGTYDSGLPGSTSQSYRQITADLRMSLLDGGVMSARVKAAEAGGMAQSEAVKSTSQKVVLDALTAYLQVQRYDLKMLIAHRSTLILEELGHAEQRRVALGAVGQNNLRMAGARRAGTAARELEFDALRGEAAAKFETYFRLKANTLLLSGLAVPLAWRPASLEQALQQAEAQSSELTEAQERVTQARAVVDQQSASIYPTLDAVLVKTKDPRGLAVPEPTRASLELNWNFGNGFDQQTRLKGALAEVANQEAKQESVKLNLTEVTTSSWNRAVAGREREKQLLEAVSESGEAFRGRRRLLELGRETLPAVLDAQVDYYTLLLDYVDALFDLRLTEFRVARATGRLWVAPDSDNAWVTSIFSGAVRPLLTPDGMLSTPCNAKTAPCVVASGSSAKAPAGLALQAATRLKIR